MRPVRHAIRLFSSHLSDRRGKILCQCRAIATGYHGYNLLRSRDCNVSLPVHRAHQYTRLSVRGAAISRRVRDRAAYRYQGNGSGLL